MLAKVADAERLGPGAPRETDRLLDAWAAIRPPERFAGRSPVPGRG